MTTDLRRIPGVLAKGRRPERPRHRDSWGLGSREPQRRPRLALSGRRSQLRPRRRVPAVTALLAVGYLAAAAYGVGAVRSYTRVDVEVAGLVREAVFTSTGLAGQSIHFAVAPTKHLDRTSLTLDGVAIPTAERQIVENGIVWRPVGVAEGRHEIELSVPRPGLGDYKFHRRFVVDDSPPAIGVAPLLEPAGVCAPITVRGQVEPSSTLTLDGAPVAVVKGAFAVDFPRSPAAPLHFISTDTAGNSTAVDVVAPVRYPGGQGIHVTAAAWGYEPLRRGILALIDAKLVSAVELDLKDEGGIVGFNSTNAMARQIGAVIPEYDLKATVADLKARGVRVIGRIVAFRDAPLAKWSWDNGRRDWVVQTPDGKLLGTYGGFSNLAHPEVQQYNLDLALEAADAGVDDILWDYVRRPEGDPATMVIPGIPERVDSSSTAIAGFLAASQAALRDRCVYQGASVFGIAADRPDAVGQDVPRIARHVDYIAPMVYPSHWVNGEYGVANPNKQPYDIVKAALADFQAKTAGTGVTLMPWLQDFSLGATYGPAEVKAQLDGAASLGITDWLLWNAGASYTSGALDPSRLSVRR